MSRRHLVRKHVQHVLSRRSLTKAPLRLVTGLQARTFAVWTALSGVVRLYAAYNTNHKVCVLGPHPTIRAATETT